MLVPGINCPKDFLHYTKLFLDEEIGEIQCNTLGRVLQPVKKFTGGELHSHWETV